MPEPEPKAILVHGTLCLDRVLRVEALPEPGGYVEAIEETFGLGGEAANTTAALAKWGAKVRFLPNPIGTDAAGDRLVALAAAAGLPLDAIERRPGFRTPVTDIYVTPDGGRTMFGVGFSALAEEPLAPFDCSGAGWFTTDSNLGALGILALDYACEQCLLTVALDYAHRPPVPAVGLHLTSLDWLREPAVEWASRNRQTVLLTRGERGSELCVPGEAPRRVTAFPAPAVVDTTGAGDCFRAGLLFGLQRGLSIPHAARFGAAAAALSVAGLGACGAIPSVAEVEALIVDNPEVSKTYD